MWDQTSLDSLKKSLLRRLKTATKLIEALPLHHPGSMHTELHLRRKALKQQVKELTLQCTLVTVVLVNDACVEFNTELITLPTHTTASQA